MYLSGQLFFKTTHEILKFQEIFKKIASPSKLDLNFKTFLFSVYHGATPQNHWTKYTVGTESLRENSCGHKYLDKYLLEYNLKNFIKESTDNIFFSYLAIITSTFGHIQADGHFNNWNLSKPQIWQIVEFCKSLFGARIIFEAIQPQLGSHRLMVTWTIKYCWNFNKFQIVKSFFDSRIIV